MWLSKSVAMKKSLLFLILIAFAMGAEAQTRHLTDGMLPGPRVLYQPATPDGVAGYAPLIPGEKMLSFETIGNTWYDTQTYNAGNLMNRVWEYPDGTIGATWMHQAATPPPDRGSAYNYFNGTGWTGQVPHLGGDSRNGHPVYLPWGPTGELIVHYQYILNDSPLKILRRDVKGQGEWQESVLTPPDGNYSLVWHSAMTSGANHEYLHILALVYDDPYQGQDDALLYYRSPDGGVTWDINGVVIDGLGPEYFTTIPGLRYNWANPVGDTIAFSFGFDHFDGLVFKSTDNGANWEKITVYQAPYTPFDLPDLSPTYGGGDGSSAIALDSQGKVHVAFGRMLHIYDIVSSPPGGWYFYPATEGIIYWNETMPILDSTAISSYTLENLIAGGNLVGWVVPADTTITLPSGQPNYGVGLTSGPQWGIDADDNMYLAWDALAPLYNDGQYFFRHIYGNASFDGGASWQGIKDLTGDFLFSWSECAYPAIAPVVNDKINLVFQEDFTTGTGAGEENFIDYLDFPKDFFVGTPEHKAPGALKVSQCYPNPASGEAAVKVTLDKPANLTVTLSGMTGQVIKTLDKGQLPAGDQIIRISLEGIQPGVYVCTVYADGTQSARKLTVR